MNELYFEKLRSCYLNSKFEVDNLDKIDKMIDIYNQIVDFSRITRTEGLLSLIDAATDLNESDACELFLKNLLMLIADGTDPEKVEEFGLSSVLSGDFDSFDSIICLMCLRGASLSEYHCY